MNNFDYDSANDILYCTFGDKQNSYGDEEIDNIVIMRDLNTEDITGITVLDFFKMYRLKDNRIKVLAEYICIENIIKEIKC